jgi:cyclopropane fatty-acyl-phospholipid synthase-like methyltransferase
MSVSDEIYAAIEASEMRTWVGDGDHRFVGKQNLEAITANFPLEPTCSVLDFGCGIGRTAIELAAFLKRGRLVGTDIVPGLVRFCQDQFESRYPNARFFCTRSNNPLYENLIAVTKHATERIDEDEFFEYCKYMFDLLVAFSVFTHFSPPMTEKYLKLLRPVVKNGGYALLTFFLDHPDNPSHAKLLNAANFLDGMPDVPLTLAIYAPGFLMNVAHQSRFAVERISYGYWRRAGSSILHGGHYQDVVILRAA